ncbi:hypothetical protein GCM10011613_19680 [Cellvibrio zantedeschiae]|uniref:Uncharacterized protein n=1 Tax=Cellvibrio zantedeschiae TaxID=1237077 RepID=A0ABQ3B2F3_9GAMM|nr:hypothetical protein GCM10011613_19680 [Cellvibrio zantedeschiae]
MCVVLLQSPCKLKSQKTICTMNAQYKFLAQIVNVLGTKMHSLEILDLKNFVELDEKNSVIAA